MLQRFLVSKINNNEKEALKNSIIESKNYSNSEALIAQTHQLIIV